ncbi:MAG: hypothetical protein RIR26_83 [Pseudomonadota bacterium]|jgi:SAM-dependent methyltransferase
MKSKTEEFYDSNAETFSSSTLHLDLSDLYFQFLRNLTRGRAILDVGCGSGRDSKFFYENGFSVTSIDSSSEMVKLAIRNTGLTVLKMNVEEIDFESAFNGIWACASLLHIPSATLPSVFLKLARALKQGGILYCSFKYGAFEGERNGRYFTDLVSDRLDALVSGSGLVLESHWITEDLRPTHSNEKWLNSIFLKK